MDVLTRSAKRFVQGALGEYHFGELCIALDPAHPAHSLPSIQPGEKTLDIGCGAGQSLIAACPYRVPGEGGLCVTCSVTDCPPWGYGIDVDTEALLLGNEWSRKLTLKPGSAENIPYSDAEFDLVMARVSLVFADLPKAAAEMRRALKPGGRLWITLQPFATIAQKARTSNWKGLIYRFYVAVNGLIFHLTLHPIAVFGKRESWQTSSGMRRLLLRAGFTDVRVYKTKRCFLVTARR